MCVCVSVYVVGGGSCEGELKVLTICWVLAGALVDTEGREVSHPEQPWPHDRARELSRSYNLTKVGSSRKSRPFTT